jgi:regulator of sigma E protease
MNLSGDFLITLLQFIIVLGLLVFFHEFGHYIIARIFHIEIEEFGFGFPPRMVKLFTLAGTDFTLNWIPFGAFVRPKGENDPNVPGGLASAPPLVRLGVLLGGPAMNLIIGVIVFSFVFMRVGAPEPTIVEVVQVNENTPASQAGFQEGDVITQVNGQKIDSTTSLHAAIQDSLGKEITVVYSRQGQTMETRLTPRTNPPEGQGPIGIVLGNPFKPITMGQAIATAGATVVNQANQLLLLPVRLIQGEANPGESRVVGPKGMFDIYTEARRMDSEAATSPAQQPAVNVLWFVGIISIALGITNLLPIPALDGGRILFVLPELILRRRVPAQYENLIHLVGFAALLLLMGYVTIQDFANPILMP